MLTRLPAELEEASLPHISDAEYLDEYRVRVVFNDGREGVADLRPMSVYEYVIYESEVEREFALRLDEREDIRLFVKLPGWFEIDTPVGKYNPDWAILKHDGQALYLVRETNPTRNFLKLRTSEADKVRCGQKHFEAIGVPFAVAVTADEV